MSTKAEKEEVVAAQEFVNVDDFLPDEWPAGLADALGRWRTGDLLRRPALSWAGPAADDVLTGAPAGTFDWEPIADETAVVPYGILCSQTCDIGSTGPGGKHPFVQVAPVVRCNHLEQGIRNDIRAYRVTYLFALPDPPEEGFWVADLRLFLTASKSLLAAAGDPIDAFGGDEQERLRFAEVLARKVRRPAVHAVLSEALPRSLDGYIKLAGKAKPVPLPDWLDKVVQVRVEITDDRLAPTSARLYVISDAPLEGEERKLWRDWFTTGRKLLKEGGVSLERTQFTTMDKMSAATYVRTLPVSVAALGRPPAW